jgi:hypothetical protein
MTRAPRELAIDTIRSSKVRKRRPGTVWTADGDGLGGSG